ncbi:hypothetical protein [Actinoallomurus sp. CA-150999]|uniref:hypothetical protein n=1 Tax=Actinoallomurus sp. CA-150999 TaxID=3239887 RepID=UPI003D8B86AF
MTPAVEASVDIPRPTPPPTPWAVTRHTGPVRFRCRLGHAGGERIRTRRLPDPEAVEVRAGMSLAELGGLPTVVDLVTAGKALGLGRTKTYELAQAGEFPCRIIRVGKKYLVPTPELLALLGYQYGVRRTESEGE